jgi:hypothetical protein
VVRIDRLARRTQRVNLSGEKEEVYMTYHRTLVVITCVCAVLIQLAHALESTAQPRLVPVTCNNNETYPGLSCLDSLFVEEGTIPPDSC